MKKIFILVAVCGLWFSSVVSQTKEEIKGQAEQRLGTMSPQQIDAAIKQYGMTRSEAEAKAAEYGIDLEEYLTKHQPASLLQPQQPTVGGTTVIIQAPQQTPQPVGQISQGNQTQSAVAETYDVKNDEVDKQKSNKDSKSDIFGLSFFKSGGASFEPSPSIADESYIVGAGDVLKISLWGDAEFTSEFVVDKDGRIVVPSVGPIFVSGYSLADAKKRIQVSMSKSYSGLISNPPRIFLDLSISKLRPIRVFIMGEVTNPGGYLVNNFGSVFNSLFAAGGPKESGSLRDVRVIRNNKTIARVDLYDYLIGAPKTNDLRVNDNDIIFVPLRGKTVKINGQVDRSFQFELLPNENLKKLIEFSGGLRSDVYKERIQVNRIIPFNERVKGQPERKIFDVEFTDIASGKKDYVLEDGDIVTIFRVLNEKLNYVTITGDVWRPGTFQAEKIKTVKELIEAADGLRPTAYKKRAELTRLHLNERLETIVLDLEKVLANDPAHNIALQFRDKLKIYSISDINSDQTITISGYVKNPGFIPYSDNLKLYDVIFPTVADTVFRKNLLMERGDVVRQNSDKRSTTTIPFNVWDVFMKRQGDMVLQGGDRVILYSLDAVEIFQNEVEIFGNVKNPGKYKISDGMTLRDLIIRAEGYTIDAWTVKAEIARTDRFPNGKDSVTRIFFSSIPDFFDTTLSIAQRMQSSAGNFVLRANDKVFIRPNPDYLEPKLVTVNGEVKYWGKYALSKKNETVTDLIARAGGIDANGYARGAKLRRNNQYIRFNLENALENPKGDEDIILQEGDEVFVPVKPNTVLVQGEVNNPGLYGFVKGESRDFYIDRAGGITDSADFALVTYPEGYVMQTDISWFIFNDNPGIPDGSVITVTKIKPPPTLPEGKKEDIDLNKVLRDTITFLASVLTLAILMKQL